MTLRETVEEIRGTYTTERQAMWWANKNFGELSAHIRAKQVHKLVYQAEDVKSYAGVKVDVKERAKKELKKRYENTNSI